MNIIITGGLGFIGANLVNLFKKTLECNLIIVETKEKIDKTISKSNGIYILNEENVVYIERNELFNLFKMSPKVDYFIHLGAITDTTSTNQADFLIWNLEYSKRIWEYCSKNEIPLIYASSAATYGSGEKGFSDLTPPQKLNPLNFYGKSKNDFDIFVSESEIRPPFWAGLKFFNVYGYGEQHKKRMASVVYHAYNQIRQTGTMKLFKYGEQKRDFVFVEDVCNLFYYLMFSKYESGIYNVGTGQARTFNDLIENVFLNMKIEKNIEYIDMPQDLIGIYQSFTQSESSKIPNFTYTTLEKGIELYIRKLNFYERGGFGKNY